jgi:hypothetical protein
MPWTIPNLVLHEARAVGQHANPRASPLFVNCGTSNLGTGEGRQRSQMKQRASIRKKSKSRSSSTCEERKRSRPMDALMPTEVPHDGWWVQEDWDEAVAIRRELERLVAEQ